LNKQHVARVGNAGKANRRFMIRYLKTFLAVSGATSFTAAGEKIGLTQAGVSARIKALEYELNCSLFERSPKGIALTHEGQMLVPLVTRMLTLSDVISQGSDAAPALRASLKLGAITTAQQSLLPDALQIFTEQFPGVEVSIAPGMSINILAQVESGELDMGVIIPPFSARIPKELDWKTIVREPYCAIGPKSSTETTAAHLLRNHPFIRYNRFSYAGRQVDEYLSKHRIRVAQGIEVDEPTAIVKMVERNIGASILPLWLALDGKQPDARVIKLDGAPVYREIGVVQRKSQAANPLFVAMTDAFTVAADRLIQRAGNKMG
jgi:DNA-binding transcriptional LysR family regulator